MALDNFLSAFFNELMNGWHSGITKLGRGTRRLPSAIALTPLLKNPRFLIFSLPAGRQAIRGVRRSYRFFSRLVAKQLGNRKVSPTPFRCGLPAERDDLYLSTAYFRLI